MIIINNLKKMSVYAEEIFKNNDLKLNSLEFLQENTRTIDYIVNGNKLLRFSKNHLSEIDNLKRNKSIPFSTQIYTSGTIDTEEGKFYYVLIDYAKGEELYKSIPKLSKDESISIGKNLALFLEKLHSVKNTTYDIGHYIPTIPKYSGLWKEGHLEYLKWLSDNIYKLTFTKSEKTIIDKAFEFCYENIDALEFQKGPVLLHNDLHPKNIIIEKDSLSGVIDWECSQFGESDFELVHLFHWCIYPPEKGYEFVDLLKVLYNDYMQKSFVPSYATRLTIYQLEHDLNQIIWQNKKDLELRLMRINGWLSKEIDKLIIAFLK